MGNTSSGQGTSAQEKSPSSSWSHSQPRSIHNILPEQITKHRLRLTENGAIIHNGGTISIRRQIKRLQNGGAMEINGGAGVDRGFYGSAPDLRITSHQSKKQGYFNQTKVKMSRSRKKYKAPPVPHAQANFHGESSSPDSYQEWEKSRLPECQPTRRLRLFRTRAETKKRLNEPHLPSFPPSGLLQRSLSTPQLQQGEMMPNGRDNLHKILPTDPSNNDDINKLPHRPSSESRYRTTNNNIRNSYYRGNGESPGYSPSLSNEEESSSWHRISPTLHTDSPVKKFYFGMNEEVRVNEAAIVEKFAEKLHHITNISSPTQASTTSSSESCTETNLDENGRGICVQLRATLPRKQLDIPRFSPTAAWRLLSTFDSPLPSEEDDLIPLEDRIPAPPHPLHIPSHIDKSADSGISGDASPQHHDSTHNSQAAWTPQQDLEETSSEGESVPVSPESLATAKYSPRFSLSLPRDNRLKLYSPAEKEETPQPVSLQSLKKLKRSMSGVLGKVNNVPKEEPPSTNDASQLLDNNWVLSRSVPNSLNIPNVNLIKWSADNTNVEQEQELPDISLTKQPSFLYLANGGHVMYLPSYTTPRERSVGALAMSKSCEDLSCGDNDGEDKIPEIVVRTMEVKTSGLNRKFTYQSTVRQLERKRIAEKLSKQAEHRERQRHSEIEAMRRVEEEFQKKREREKADIRQQLRLYSIKQSETELDVVDSPPVTQVLSEFRQPHRDYREYRPQRGGMDPDIISLSDSSRKRETVHPKVVYKIPKSTQVYITSRTHVTRSTGGEISVMRSPATSDNYRKDFAQGALPFSLASSDSEVSQPNSRQVQNRPVIEQGGSPEPHSDSQPSSDSPSSLDSKFSDQSNDTLEMDKKQAEGEPDISSTRVNFTLQPFVKEKTYRPVQYNLAASSIAQQIAT